MKIIETTKTTSNEDDEDGVILDSSSDECDYSEVDDAFTTEGEAEYDPTATIRTMATRNSAAASMRSTVEPSMVTSVIPSTSKFGPRKEAFIETLTVEETPNVAMATPRQSSDEPMASSSAAFINSLNGIKVIFIHFYLHHKMDPHFGPDFGPQF
jgi:hypothetical protein